MTHDEARDLFTRLGERLSPAVLEPVTAELVRLGPDALKLIFHVPQALIHPPLRRWLVPVALQMDRAAVDAGVDRGDGKNTDWRIFPDRGGHTHGHGRIRAGCPRVQAAILPHGHGEDSDALLPAPAGRPVPLLQVGDRSLIPLIAAMLRDQSAAVRAMAVEVLSKSEAHECQAEIVAALGDSDQTVRAKAVQACGRMRLPVAVDRLVAMLPTTAGIPRAEVIYALDRIGDVRRGGKRLCMSWLTRMPMCVGRPPLR